ncbi:DNA topoisomerase 2-binding protein 1-like isoform X2 [Eriocheir sinensis]|uniref:DNA topoisomerase 2-binding protein 1-like isoform X2 n=1 Tax=Eriocheir sinensis TaxID=95602 RepID=UPI0021C73607|nr:DNA topoisomerase 2-binding protein 1-like isoform X2 [Eriocheir sinensis]
MEASLCSQEDTVNLFFVHPPGDGLPSNILLCALQACEEKLRVQWLSQEECIKVTPAKEDIFVCDPFEGEAFDYLVNCPKSIVVGPKCILSCLHRMEPIPSLPSPLHNTAMNRLVITTTGFSRPEKEELQRLIKRMSGIYSNNYNQDVTHLVVKMVGSEKYKVAVEQQIPIMTEGWVMSVWEAVVKEEAGEHVSATDELFLPYKCKPLHGLVVCVSQVDQDTKADLKRIIEENGATYTNTLDKGSTSVLIVSSPEGKKYNFAIKWGIYCLYPEWLYHSVQQGHALNEEEYEVQARKTSTFTDSCIDNELPSDFSLCSTILNDTSTQRTITSIDETASLESLARRKSNTNDEADSQQEAEEVEALNLQEALKADNFLAGCRVYLAGFTPIHTEKLRRVLGAGGASRLSQLTESVTHVLLASPKADLLKNMHGWATKPHIVSVRWIAESMQLKRPADESNFLIHQEADWEQQPFKMPSTATQRSSISTSMVDYNDETHVDEALLHERSLGPRQRRERGASMEETAHDVSTLPQSQASELPGIFSGKNFTILGHNQEIKEELAEMIELNGGHVVSLAGQEQSASIHYMVITAGGDADRALYHHHHHQGHNHHTQLISPSFLEDCVESQRLLPVEYYHLPLLLPADSVSSLDGCCITVSVYAHYERRFLEHLVVLLGARNQDKFSRTAKADKNLQASTHLVCPTPTGTKYTAAKKWGVKAVTCDWLIECAQTRSRVPEKPFLVGSGDPVQVPRKAVIRELWDCAVVGGETREEGEEEEIPATPAMSRSKPFHSSEALASLSPLRIFDREAISENGGADPAGRASPPVLEFPTPGTTRFNKTKREAELDAMPTPDTSYGCTWHHDPSPRLRKCIKRCIDSLPDVPDQPKSPTVKDMFTACMEASREELKRHQKKHQQMLEKILRKEKERKTYDKEGQEEESAEAHHHSIVNGGDGKQEEEGRGRKAKEEESLSHQLEELARASLVERSGGGAAGGSSKVPLGELQKPVNSSKTHLIALESQPTEEEELPLATQITWDDPQELEARLSLQEQMQKDTQDFSLPSAHKAPKADSGNNSDDEYNKENIPSSPPSNGRNKNSTTTTTAPTTTKDTTAAAPPPPGQLVFKLGSMSDDKFQEYIEVVTKLGGALSYSQTRDPQITHLVTMNPSCSEVTLTCIVSGKWILMSTYLDDSLKAGYFLEEEPYSWGNPAALHTPQLDLKSSKIAAAAWRWKCSIGSNGELDSGYDGDQQQQQRQQHHQQRRPFEHMTALIHTRKDRSQAFTRLIEAGGGQVISARPPYSKVEGVTHFFVEMEKTPEKIDLASFASRGIPCLQPVYLNHCILEEDPDITQAFIPEYKEIMANMSTCIPSPLKRATHRN